MVFWMTNEQTPTSIVRYGTDPNDLDQYSAEWKPGEPQRQYEWNKRGYLSNWMHKIYLRGLEPSTIYFYKCGDEDDGWSAVYWFHTRAEGPGSTVRIAALADQVGLCTAAAHPIEWSPLLHAIYSRSFIATF